MVLMGGGYAGATPLPTTPPVSIDEAVTDPTTFLSTREAGYVRNAIAATAAKGVNTKYVLVPDFSGYDPTDWCAQSANQTVTQADTVVFVLAYEERDSSWCTNIADGSPLLTDSQIDRAWDAALEVAGRSDPMSPEDAAWAGVAFAQSLEATLDSGGASSGSGWSLSGAWIVVLALTVIGATWMVIRSSSKKNRLRKAGGAQNPTPANAQEKIDLAQTQLLASDEVLRNAADEVMFAQAQLGYGPADKLDAAVKKAQAEIGQAFTLLPQMQDAANLGARAAVATQILDKIQVAMPPVYAAQQELKELRDRQLDAKQRLADLRARLEEARKQVSRSEKTLDDLRLRFTPQQLQSLELKPSQANAFLSAATQNCDDAQRIIDSDRAGAVEALDRATSQLASGLKALNAIDTADTTIGESNKILASAIASITADLDDVDRLATNKANFAPLIHDAREAVAAGQAARNGQGDPLAALEKLRSAEDALDRSLDPLRSAHDQRQRNEAVATERIAAAQSMVAQAEAALSAARNYGGIDARAALSTAQQQLGIARASQRSDPAAAVTAANNALNSAQNAMTLLRNAPGTTNVNHRSSGNNSLLWGMILGSMMGGGNRGRSYGNSWGTTPKRSGYGGSARGGGSFGGPSRSTGRSSGGFRGGSSGGFRGGSSGGFRGGGGSSRGKF